MAGTLTSTVHTMAGTLTTTVHTMAGTLMVKLMAGTLEALEGKLRFYEQNIFHLKECASFPLALPLPGIRGFRWG